MTSDSDSDQHAFMHTSQKAEKFGSFGKKRAKSVNRANMWEEIDSMYRDMELREKDYQVAMEIGKMLLDKNQELEDQLEQYKQQTGTLQVEREQELDRLRTENDQIISQRDELRSEVKQLKLQINLLQTGKGDSEMQTLLLSEEYSKMEEQLAEYKKEQHQYKQKHSQLVDELESYKAELEQTRALLDEKRKKTITHLPETESHLGHLPVPELGSTSQRQQQHQHQQQLAASEEAKECLEKERTQLELTRQRLEKKVAQLNFENAELKELLNERDDERIQLERMVDSLSKAQYILQTQYEEVQRLLEERTSTIAALRARLDEQQLQVSPSFRTNLQLELLQTRSSSSEEGIIRSTSQTSTQRIPSYSQLNLPQKRLSILPNQELQQQERLEIQGKKEVEEDGRETDSINHNKFKENENNNNKVEEEEEEQEEEDEEEEKLIKWKEKLEQLQLAHEETKMKEERFFNLENRNTLSSEEKKLLMEELKQLRNIKSEEDTFLGIVHELRERLRDAEIKNLARTMRNVNLFNDLVLYSNCIIDTVLKDIQRKVIDDALYESNNMIHLIADLILENCRLRKVANDYAEAINQGTIDKLNRFRKYWPTSGSMVPRDQVRIQQQNSFWNHLPLFDFFTGWRHLSMIEDDQQKETGRR